MAQPIIIKGEFRVILPLKSFKSIKYHKRQLEDQNEDETVQPASEWKMSDSTSSKRNELVMKKRAHQHYKRQAQKRATSLNIVTNLHSPAVDPFNTWPIEPTPDVPRMAQYC